MRLIFVTRKIDRQDTRTGFVFDWIEALASRLDRFYIICQELGDSSNLPRNVEVHSFGKEKKYGKVRQLFNLLFLIFKFSKNSSGIFAHMMPVYAIVAWLPAKLFGKKLVLWYTHKSVDLKLRIAHALADTVLTASKESFRLTSKKVRIVGHGIPVEKFFPLPQSLPPPKADGGGKVGGRFQILSIGRISRVKDYETLIKAVEILVNDKSTKDVQVDIYGDPATAADLSYQQSLREFVNQAGLQDNVLFHGGVAYKEIQELYNPPNSSPPGEGGNERGGRPDLFVNLSQTGSIDKTVLEAAASGTLVLTSNEAFIEPLSRISPLFLFKRNHPQDLADCLIKIRELSDQARSELRFKLREWVESEHNLDNLAEKIISEFRST